MAMKLLRALRRERPLRTLKLRMLLAFPWEIGYLRYLWLARIKARGVESHDTPHRGTQAIDYSASYMGRYAPDRRVQWTMFLLAAIPDCGRTSLLVIGPRYEPELLMARGLGWDPAGVRGLDTFSYSPHIDVGDMHELPYPDGSFEAVTCAWTLSYSSTPDLAAHEMQRVLRPGGYLVVSMQKTQEEFEEVLPGVLRGGDRVQTLGQLDQLFANSTRVAGFEPVLDPGETGHTIAAYRRDP